MSHHVDRPDCAGDLRIRTSYAVGDTVRRLTYECMNEECGASFVATVSIDARLSLPAQPNTKVMIPLSRHVNRARLRALLDGAPEADYTPRTMPPQTGELFDAATGPPVPSPA